MLVRTAILIALDYLYIGRCDLVITRLMYSFQCWCWKNRDLYSLGLSAGSDTKGR